MLRFRTTTFFTEFRFDMRIRNKRYEVCRFPGQEIRLQWVTNPRTGTFYLWVGAWRLTIFRLKPRPPLQRVDKGYDRPLVCHPAREDPHHERSIDSPAHHPKTATPGPP